MKSVVSQLYRARNTFLLGIVAVTMSSCTPLVESLLPRNVCLTNVKPATVSAGTFVINGTISQAHLSEHRQSSMPDVMVLHNSNGGSVYAGSRLSERVNTVHITGNYCASMCVYVALQHPNVLLSPELQEFTFHSVVNTNQNTCKATHNKRRTESFVRQYPPALQRLLQPLLEGDRTIKVPVKRVEELLGKQFQRLPANG